MTVSEGERPEVPGYVLLAQAPALGRTARVYKAVSVNDGGMVAIKVLTASVEQGEFLDEAFRRETEALAGLAHPNIVRLRQSGIAPGGYRFIVLDWMDRDLPTWKRDEGWTDWDSFWSSIGRPLASAMAHAHAGEVAHRDLAPRNVMLAPDGSPLVADFGIAKLRRFLRSDRTLRQFVSPPFTPPETDDGSGTYARDVFSLASLFCWAAASQELATYAEVAKFAACSDTFPAAVRAVLVQALSDDIDERPATAEEMLDRLDLASRQQAKGAALSCQLALGVVQAERIARAVGVVDRRAAEAAIIDDLNAACGIEPRQESDGGPGTAFGDLVLYGLTRSYHVRVDEVTRDRLVVLSTREGPAGFLEARREEAVTTRVEFRFHPKGAQADRRAILDLQQLVDEHLRDREGEDERDEGRAYATWSAILRARQDLELSRERIDELQSECGATFDVVRVGTNDDRISDTVEPLRLHRRLQAWTDEVATKVADYAAAHAADEGVDSGQVVVGMALERLLAAQQDIVRTTDLIAVEEAALKRLGARNDDGDIRVGLDVGGSVADRRLEIARQKEARKEARDAVAAVREELAALGEEGMGQLEGADLVSAVDLYLGGSAAIARVRPLIELGADWIARFGRQDHFEGPFLSTVHVVSGTCLGVVGPRSAAELRFDLCIVDEASKATATEMLVPLSRASRWVLVGDSRQLPPFQDEAMRDDKLLKKYELRREDVAESLFGYLERLLPAANVLSLTTQRRMIQPINDMVRDCFYPGQRLDCARSGPDRRFGPALPSAVTWLTTSRSAKRRETVPKSGIGCFNRLECELVGKRLKRLNRQFQRRDPGLGKGRVSVAVITGYVDQLRMLDRTLNPAAANWTHLDIQLNTVDAFQGRQADMVVYSVSRSNKDRFLGFLRELPRLNVALSRGRDAVLIVGDMDFCEGAREPNPFRDVIRWFGGSGEAVVEEVE